MPTGFSRQPPNEQFHIPFRDRCDGVRGIDPGRRRERGAVEHEQAGIVVHLAVRAGHPGITCLGHHASAEVMHRYRNMQKSPQRIHRDFSTHHVCYVGRQARLGIVQGLLPLIEVQKPMKPLALAIKSQLAPGDRIIGYRMNVHASLPFYTAHEVQRVETPNALRAAVCAPGRVFLAGFDRDLGPLRAALPPGVHTGVSYGDAMVFIKPAAVRCG